VNLFFFLLLAAFRTRSRAYLPDADHAGTAVALETFRFPYKECLHNSVSGACFAGAHSRWSHTAHLEPSSTAHRAALALIKIRALVGAANNQNSLDR
jgi:hypothetical protein